MATVTFAKGASTATIQAPKYPEEPGHSYPQIVGRTMGGGHNVADLGDGSTAHERAVLHFRNMSSADWSALYTFITSTVSWSQDLFTYTDAFSVAHTDMRYIEGIERARRTQGDKMAVDLVIEKDMDG